MSVCRKLPDGTIQKIAGHTILLGANASEVRQGNITIPISPENEYAGTVTFSDPMPDNDYVVVLNVSAWNEDGYIYGTPYRVDNKTTTGFKICGWKAESSQTTKITFEWTAFKPIKLDGYTALQNKVNSPDETPTIDSMNLVTSDGVARAIKNASAVWKGTKAEWNALPAAEKQTYDLAVLLDKTLVKAVDREDGTETDVANLNKIFRGTKAEWQALTSAQKDAYDQAEVIDEYTGVPVVVDKVESGNLNPVTSNAVAGNVVVGEYATAKIITVPINATPVNYLKINLKKGKWIVHARARTDISSEQDVLLSMYLSTNPDVTQGNAALDQRAQLAGVWHFVNSFLPITLAADTTLYIRLCNSSTVNAITTIEGTVYAVKVAD